MPGRLILLCGRSFSGKSTVAAALATALGGTIVSCDAINAERDLRGGQGIPMSEWARTFEIANQRAADALSADRIVIVDDTSSPRFLRDKWRVLSSATEARLVLVFLDAAPHTILERQAGNRSGRQRDDVTDAVMTEHLANFEPPDADENALSFAAENLVTDVVIAEIAEALSASR